jgi:CPA2 family monovalent cation:H+ antiporter-2
MFSLGLEFSLRRLARVGRTAGIIALLEVSVLIWLGYTAGRLFGWSFMDAMFLGAGTAISSTTIIVKVFQESRVQGAFTDIVFGILVVEDLIAIVLMAVLTAVTAGGSASAELGFAIGRLALFLVALLLLGMLLVPRLVRAVIRLQGTETMLVVCMGLCFTSAWLAQTAGYSVALGAFLAGALVSESGHAKRIEPLVEPVRDMFVAIFFVAIGMLLDPALVYRNAGAVVVLVLLVILGKVGAVTFSTFLTGAGIRSAVQTGMSLAQIGEFSFIIAGIGVTAGVTSPSLFPILVAVSAITTLTSPWLVRHAEHAAAAFDRNLPRSLQTFVALYGSWIESMGSRPETSIERIRFRRSLRLLLLDACVIAALAIGAAMESSRAAPWLTVRLGVSPGMARAVILAVALLLSLPFLFGIVRTSRTLGQSLARRAFPDPEPNRLDLAAAPRRALVVTIQLATVALVGAPLVAVLQPFVPPGVGIGVFLLGLVVLGFIVWRSAADLQGHVRAAAEAIVDALKRHAQGEPSTGEHALERAYRLLPGLGEPFPVKILATDAAVGRRLSELELRGRTGATVIAISRDGDVVLVPDGHVAIQAGDVVALAGTREAIDSARRVLAEGIHESEGPEDLRATSS